jgi:ribonuclease T2
LALLQTVMENDMRTVRILMTAMVAALTGPSLAFAQGLQCAVPQSLASPRSENPPPGLARNLPLTGLVLALSWSPQFCKTRGGGKKDTQCNAEKPFGFILHGLWPDAEGQSEPRWCKPVPALSRDLVRQNFCNTPSVQLQQHEWAKHGTCITRDPARYFESANRLFGVIRTPDMDALSRKPLDVGDFVSAFVAANPELSESMMRVDLSDIGWLEEVRICYGTDYKPRACPRDISGASAGAKIRIWRTQR